jgi:hypothetical protein
MNSHYNIEKPAAFVEKIVACIQDKKREGNN